MNSDFMTTCQSTGTWTPTDTCERESEYNQLVFLLFVASCIFSHSLIIFFSHTVVDCGFPKIPEDGVLQPVGSDEPHTQYKDEIHFNCTSKYYTLEGDGDYMKLLLASFLLWLIGYSLRKFPLFNLSDTFICSASGEWLSARGNAAFPKCIPGTDVLLQFSVSQHSCRTLNLLMTSVCFSVWDTGKLYHRKNFGR